VQTVLVVENLAPNHWVISSNPICSIVNVIFFYTQKNITLEHKL